MALRDISLKKIYRSPIDKIVEEFFAPVLREATYYERGTGYFSLSSLAALADGIIPFIKNKGCIKIITSVQMSYEDMMIIRKGLEIKEPNIIKKIEELINEKLENTKDILKLDVITNLIACERLKIKIAYMPKGGIYHEKFGIFFDDNDAVYFMGSPNETFSGLKTNLESIMVLSTWEDAKVEIAEQHNYFQNLWDDNIRSIKVFSFPEALQQDLLRLYKKSPDVETAIKRMEKTAEEETQLKKLHPYQEDAIREFENNGYCHFFEMATGTGKTFTAVKAYEKLAINEGYVPTIVLVPQIDLQSQWINAFHEVNIEPLLFGGLANSSETQRNISNFAIFSYDRSEQLVAISTYDTFFSKAYRSVEGITCRKFLIVDEAHNLTPNQIKKLPVNFDYRLGLSATPERYEKDITDSIINYFTLGNIETFKYTIEEAIDVGYLSHYEYYPIKVPLTEDEFNDYKLKTRQYIIAKNEKEPDFKKIKDILMKRSSTIKKSTNKLNELKKMILKGDYDFKNSVIYCGNGKDLSTDESIINIVTKILTVNGNYKVSQFTSKTIDRAAVLKEFENGNYDVLAAIKCFDEGVDVPKLDKIFILSSDGLKRQTIQRRGRVLRKCKESGKTKAYIYDFVSIPPFKTEGETSCASLIANELRRVSEYGRLADNRTEVESFVNLLVKEYNVNLVEEFAEETYYVEE